MSYLRRASTKTLLGVIAVILAVAIGGTAIAVAAGGSGPTPPAKPLDQAIHDALAGKHADGVTARVEFTNNLFPSGALLGQVASPLMTGASGRLWITADGRGRIELQSDAGDVQIVWNDKQLSVYDASSNTVYRTELPGSANAQGSGNETPPSLTQIDSFLTELGLHWAVADASPTDIAGQAAYSSSLSPKHDGGLLASVELAWDATNGTPLRVAVAAQGTGSPVLALTVKQISYGAVADTAVDVAPPAGAQVVDLGTGSSTPDHGGTPAVTGLDAVRAAADFPVAAPDTLVGLPRRDIRLVGGSTAVVLYGQGLGAIALVERKPRSGDGGNALLSSLPTVSLDGVTAHELSTQLGTVLQWQTGGTAYVLAGSMPAAAAESAARAVK